MVSTKAIIEAYVRRIKRGAITIDDVPEQLKESVRLALQK